MKHTAYLGSTTEHRIGEDGSVRHALMLVVPDLTNDELVSLLGLAPGGNFTLDVTMGTPSVPLPPELPDEEDIDEKPKKKGGL